MSPSPRLVPTLRSARSSWLGAWVSCCRLRPTAASHAAGTHAPARARTHSTLGLTVIANYQPLRFLSFMQSAPRRYHYPRISRHAQRLSFLLRGSHPFLGRPLFLCFCFALRRPLFLSACFALRCALRPPARKNFRLQKQSPYRAYRRPTDERRDVRSAGMADWITARGGDTERALTAAAGPSPCDPYRQALTMRPSLKARPLVS